MDKTVAGILGAVGALAVAAPGHAAVQSAPVLDAASYADLLRPIPNAADTLRALDEAAAPEARFQEAQVILPGGVVIGHHHHHHHRYYRRRYYHHHHHHHHHHGYYR